MKSDHLPQFIARQMARYRGINKYILFAVLLILFTSSLITDVWKEGLNSVVELLK